MKLYCITHKPIKKIETLGLIPFGVGKNNFPKNYVIENSGHNIAERNINYSETSFHYWYWKNILNLRQQDEWFGMCQYRRYFVKYKYKNMIKNFDGNQGFYPNIDSFETLEKSLQKTPDKSWNSYDVILCQPWSVKLKSKTKLFKRGFKSLIKDPMILFDQKKQNIKLHFEMYHGYDNLQKSIGQLPLKDRGDFIEFISKNNELSGHCIFISKKTKLIKNFYADLFDWLFKCERIFGLSLSGYDEQRIYSFLTERYTPFWFNKYAKVKYWPWIYCDITKLPQD